jgi:thioredoxin 1
LVALVAVSFIAYRVISGESGDSKDGIKFYEGSWDSALAKAKAEQKPIFLDIYASWCGPCKMLKKKSFSDKEVGTFFNASFVNVSFDGEIGDGGMLANKFHISGYPTLIILDKNGNLVSTHVGFLPPDELLTLGKQSVRN